jgi:hypothetical protein
LFREEPGVSPGSLRLGSCSGRSGSLEAFVGLEFARLWWQSTVDALAALEEIMATRDTCCTIVPYFKIPAGNMEAFKRLCERFVEATSREPKCLYYGFSFDVDQVHCREGYADALGALAHLDNVGPILEEALKIAEITRLEVHGPASELSALREPLAGLNPQFFTLEYGFRR